MPHTRRKGHSIDRAYEHVRSLILDHKLKPGVKIKSLEIAEAMSFSRTPIKQALERLVQDGLVIKTPTRGYYVAKMGFKEIGDLYDVRMALELHALNNAMAAPIPAGATETLDAIQGRFRGAIADSTVLAHNPADVEFHLTLAALGGNAYIVQELQHINDRLRVRRRYDGYWLWDARSKRANEAADEHERIIRALKAGDSEGAVGELRNHIARAWHNYQRFLDAIGAEHDE